MELKTMIFTSFMAMSLVACGSGEDTSKPDDNKDKYPPKTKECEAAGDLCTFDENAGKWVIHKKDDNKPNNDETPAADSSFDYSDIGVTDKLEPEKRGFGFYHKGAKSPLDATWFKNKVTLSPTIPWSSTLEYDEDLWNFVAIRLTDAKNKDQKNPVKFMFDKIGTTNQSVNKNIDFFGKGFARDKISKTITQATVFGDIGNSSLIQAETGTGKPDFVRYYWNTIPAVVNTFMYRNSKQSLSYEWAPTQEGVFLNQEEDKSSLYGSGKAKLRVYGHNAFLEKTTFADLLDPDNLEAFSAKPTPIPTENREAYFPHVNFVWYDLSDFAKRKRKSTIEYVSSKTIKIDLALNKYKYTSNKDHDKFPTDVEFGVLKNVQFGRLTGEGIDPESDDISGYNKVNLKEYPFTAGDAAAAGNDSAEDWYFARGTVPTKVATLEAYKASGEKIKYDGQAVMFGLDYRPTEPAAKGGKQKSNESTNSLKPAKASSSFNYTLLDGKQNFVRMEWDPASGNITGRVFGVWTKAKYWRKLDGGTEKVYSLLKVIEDGSNTFWVPVAHIDSLAVSSDDVAKDIVASYNKDPHKLEATLSDTELKTKDSLGIGLIPIDTAENATLLASAAVELEPWAKTLVALDGKVLEGTNGFSGSAVRVRDGSKGLFYGGFFGPKGDEIGGVINSQTGSMKNQDLVDPTDKWGGAFGAKNNAKEASEDLIFQDKVADYSTSMEKWTD